MYTVFDQNSIHFLLGTSGLQNGFLFVSESHRKFSLTTYNSMLKVCSRGAGEGGRMLTLVSKIKPKPPMCKACVPAISPAQHFLLLYSPTQFT